MKKSKQPVEKKFSIKDIFIIVLSLLALVGLVFVIKLTNDEENKKREELGNISNEMQNSGTGTTVSGSTAGVMINEVNQEGWIELYYTGKTSYVLDGLQVYAGGTKVYEVTGEWRLMAGEYAVLELGVNLGASEGEVLELRKEDGSSVEYLLLPVLEAGESYGATVDGDIDKAFLSATKGESNAGAVEKQKNRLQFSVPGGFYASDFYLEISAPDGYSVFYTTDGTIPTMESSLYSDAIKIQNRSGGNYVYATGMQEDFYVPGSIDMGTVVQAIMVNSSGEIVEEKTASYFIGFGDDSDYENLPVLSITTDPDNLFDYFEGIYVKGRSYEDAVASGSIEQAANYFNGWLKSAYIEFYEGNKDKTFEGNVNLGIAWDVSIANSQKSFLIRSAEQVPAQESSLSKYFNSVSNVLQVSTYYSDNMYKIREYLTQILLDDYTDAVLDILPCIVFVDGEYWGVYMLQENFDTEYLQSVYETGDNRMMFRKNGILQEPEEKNSYKELKNAVIMNDLSVQSNYELVKAQMDIQSYIDNICINMYLANADYGSSNQWWRSWKETDTLYCDGRWRIVLPRFDNAMYNGMYGGKTTYSIDSFLMPAVAEDPFFQSLLMNQEFRAQLMDTMQVLAVEVFSQEKVDEALNQVQDYMEKASLTSYKRFSGNITSDYYDSEIEKIRSFFEQRAEYILRYTEEVVAQKGNEEVIEAGRIAIIEEQLEEQIQQETE